MKYKEHKEPIEQPKKVAKPVVEPVEAPVPTDKRKEELETHLAKIKEIQLFMGDNNLSRLSDLENAIKQTQKEIDAL